jgi:hypothetical protein
VDDHLKEPGHAGGPVRLAVREQVPLQVDVASGEDTGCDLTEVGLGLHQVRDQPEVVDLGERGLGLGEQHVPAGGAHPGGVPGEPVRGRFCPPGQVDHRVGGCGPAHGVLGENACHLIRGRRREPGLYPGQPVSLAAQPCGGLVVGQARDLPGRLEHRPQ